MLMHQALAKKRQDQQLARSTFVQNPQKQRFMQRRSTKDNIFSNTGYGASSGISRSISTAIQLDDRIREQSARKLQRLSTRAGFYGGVQTELNSLNNSTRRRFGSTNLSGNQTSQLLGSDGNPIPGTIVGNGSSAPPTTIIRNMSNISGMMGGLTAGMAPASQRLINPNKTSFILPDCDLHQVRSQDLPRSFDFETRAQKYALFGRGYYRNQMCFCIAFLFQPEMRPCMQNM